MRKLLEFEDECPKQLPARVEAWFKKPLGTNYDKIIIDEGLHNELAHIRNDHIEKQLMPPLEAPHASSEE